MVGSSVPLGNSGQDTSTLLEALMGLLISQPAAQYINGSGEIGRDAFGSTVR